VEEKEEKISLRLYKKISLDDEAGLKYSGWKIKDHKCKDRSKILLVSVISGERTYVYENIFFSTKYAIGLVFVIKSGFLYEYIIEE
jgi:hypothetical protein